MLTDDAQRPPTVTPSVFGDPGRAPGLVVPRLDPRFPGRADTVVDGFRVDEPSGRAVISVRAASVRGLSHRAYNKVRQDAYRVQPTADGKFLVVAVADGVSAGALSHFAAESAVEWACKLLAADLRGITMSGDAWRPFFHELSGKVLAECREELRRYGRPAADTRSPREVGEEMATTVSIAVLGLAPTNHGHPLWGANLGDTSIWLLAPDTGWRPFQAVKNDGADIHTSSVRALPVSSEPEPVFGHVRPGDALVVMSDGVGDALGRGTGEVGKQLAELWRKPPYDLDFASQVGFARKTYDDDRTAVALWPERP